MIRLGKKSKYNVEQVLDRAAAYFGPDGELGLRLVERGPNTIYFEDGGGSIAITAQAQNGGTDLEIVSREWDYHAEQFLKKV